MMQATARRRRLLFFGLTLTSSLLASLLMLDILRANSLTVLEAMSLVLFFGLFTWIAGAFWTAIAGFVIRLKGGDPVGMRAHDADGLAIHSRIALVMPVYNEDPRRTTAGLDAIWTSLTRQAESAAFDLFILSDTRRSEIGAAEEAAWRALVAKHGGQGRIFYRRRAQNVARKSGNIADFVRNWGAAYSHMIVLDADSVMSGKALVTLARLMDANPDVGIIQTAPLPVGRDTLFARMVQFGARLNGPMLSSGLASGSSARPTTGATTPSSVCRLSPRIAICRAFAAHAPLGGEILSHDFVEAAFMRRAGYKVWLVPDLMGSWEELPSNIIDFAGARPALGAGQPAAYEYPDHAPAALAEPPAHGHRHSFLCDLADVVRGAGAQFDHHLPGGDPRLPVLRVRHAHVVSGLARVPRRRNRGVCCSRPSSCCCCPRCWGAILAFMNSVRRRAFGGGARLAVGLLLEQLFSMLLAPPMMVFHTTFVLTTLAGKPVTWNAQDRGDRGVTFGEALTRHRWPDFARLHLGRGDPDAGAALHLVDDAGAGRPVAVGLPHPGVKSCGCRPVAAPARSAADS